MLTYRDRAVISVGQAINDAFESYKPEASAYMAILDIPGISELGSVESDERLTQGQ
jgi:hypothetical protein